MSSFPAIFPVQELRAHRGCLNGQAEFALSSLANVCRGGANMIELDVRLTSDGVAVVNHDADIARTTNGTGNVDALTFSQLRAYVIDQFGATTEKVPTLTEALDVLKAYPVRVLIEPKVVMAAKIAQAVVESAFPLERLMLAAWAGDSVAQLRAQKIFDPVPLMTVVGGTPITNGGASWIATMKAAGYQGAWFWPAGFTGDDAALCAEQDFWFSYGVDTPTVVQALNWGVPCVSTDYVGECVAAVQTAQWNAYKLGMPGGANTYATDADADGITNLEELLLGLPWNVAVERTAAQSTSVVYSGAGVSRVAHLQASAPVRREAPVFTWYPQWSDDGVTWSDVPAASARLHAGGFPRDLTCRWSVDLASPTRLARLVARPFPLP